MNGPENCDLLVGSLCSPLGSVRRAIVSALLISLATALFQPGAASAQDLRPGDERPELPDFEAASDAAAPDILPLPEVPSFTPPERSRGSALPPLDLPSGNDSRALTGGARVAVRAIEVDGNTALPPEVIEAIIGPYAGRELGFSDLQALRDELTHSYVDEGYVTSGAVIPEQSLAEGVLVVQIVEGSLDEILIENDGRLRAGYVRTRIRRYAGTPVNVRDLERGLQILQQDDRIESIHAALAPGERRGSAVLQLRVVERRPWRATLRGNNYNSPSIASGRGEVALAYRNVTGFGDSITAEYTGSEGLQEVVGGYTIPLTRWDTELGLHMRRTWSSVVEAPFDVLDIESRTETYGFTLTQPLYRSLHSWFDVFVTGEYRKSESHLLGERFSFVAGPINGIGKAAVVRVGGNWRHASRTQAFAARSMLSIGVDALGATENDGDVPDGQFVAWLAQAQWARRFPTLWDVSLLVRADVQIADRPLLGLEQFAVGGHATVRGYRENQLVRDNGLVGSLELRLPIPMPSWREWSPRFEIAPFIDAGYSWNADGATVGRTTLLSVGVGGRLALSEKVRFQTYWGHRLKDVLRVGEKSLQDDSVQMGATWDW